MSAPLTYTPAYFGLYFSLLLAVTANAFLDIGYGTFGAEVAFWAAVFAGSLWMGWRQRGHATDGGRKTQKGLLLLALLVSLIVILPIWGLPRGGVYILAALQAAYSCALTTRRQLHLGLLSSAVMVMFAASHFRADWTLLFYLVPYLVSVVFTLVAEQINRRVEDLSAQGLGNSLVAGEGAAIAAAASVILILAGLLYAGTPQITWSHAGWQFGVPAAAAPSDGSGTLPGGSGPGGGESAGGGGLTPDAMRAAARRPGMPDWQSGMINGLADTAEAVGAFLAPVTSALDRLGKALQEWLRSHQRAIVQTTAALALLALLIALWKLMREAKPGIWLATRLDYARLGRLGWHAAGNRGIIQLYSAMQRLFAWQDLPRHPNDNAREYLALLNAARSDLRPALAEMTLLFECARYGGPPASGRELSRMRELYLHLFRNAY